MFGPNKAFRMLFPAYVAGVLTLIAVCNLPWAFAADPPAGAVMTSPQQLVEGLPANARPRAHDDTIRLDRANDWLETNAPGKRIAWNSQHSSDVRTSGQVTFNALPGGLTDVTVTFQHATENLKGKAGSLLANVEGVLEEALRQFKAHVETRRLARK